jgi:hypothetical protein
LKEQKVADGEKHWFREDDPPVTKFIEDPTSLTGERKGGMAPSGKPAAQAKSPEEVTADFAATYAKVPVEERAAFLEEAKARRFSPNIISNAVNMVADQEKAQSAPKQEWKQSAAQVESAPRAQQGEINIADMTSREKVQVYKIAEQNNWSLDKAWDYFKKNLSSSLENSRAGGAQAAPGMQTRGQ